MNEESDLCASVLADPFSPANHERYATHLDRVGQSSLAEYVRLFAKIVLGGDAKGDVCELQERRKEHLDFDPSCFQWDDFLAARNVDRFRPEILKHSRKANSPDFNHEPASESSVQRLELMIGTKLPSGYRAFLTQISDGSTFEAGGLTFDPVIYNVDTMVEKLNSSDVALKHAQAESEYSWQLMMTKDDLDEDEANELVHPNHFGEPPVGFLEVAQGAIAYYYLGVRGQLRGTIWAVVDNYSAPMSAREAGTADLPESECSKEVKRLPLDAITAVYAMVMDRWEQIENLPYL